MIAAAMSKPRDSARHDGNLKLHRNAFFGEVSSLLHQTKTSENQPAPETGTVVAVNYPTDGVAALLPEHPGWGGSRNHAGRVSHALTAAQIGNLKAAERHAAAIGLPFTRMITIHWQAARVPLAGMPKATGRFTDLMTKALARHGSGTAWLWTHENVPGNDHDKGGHCHLLAHVPADLVFMITGLQRGWLRRITGNPYRARVIHSEPIGGRLGLETGNPDLHAINLEVTLGYLCKGVPQAVLDDYGIARLHKPGGRVIGKRCGTSQNIGASARKARLIGDRNECKVAIGPSSNHSALSDSGVGVPVGPRGQEGDHRPPTWGKHRLKVRHLQFNA